MVKKQRWKRVGMDASAEDGSTVIKIRLGRKGDAMATVEHLQWYEPDGHEHTGYAAATEDPARPAGEVLERYRKTGASIALASDDLWNPEWGDLA